MCKNIRKQFLKAAEKKTRKYESTKISTHFLCNFLCPRSSRIAKSKQFGNWLFVFFDDLAILIKLLIDVDCSIQQTQKHSLV